jgi:hypothetical protein
MQPIIDELRGGPSDERGVLEKHFHSFFDLFCRLFWRCALAAAQSFC